MGLLSRLLSFGGKRNNKEKRQKLLKTRSSLPALSHTDPTLVYNPTEHEFDDADVQTTISRLLRSSSARFTVLNADDNVPPVPPIPHLPMATLPMPSDSASSLLHGSGTLGLHRKGTYSVTVLSRTLESTTELPQNRSTPALRDYDYNDDDDDSLISPSIPPSPPSKSIRTVKMTTPRTTRRRSITSEYEYTPAPTVSTTTKHNDTADANRTVRYDPITPRDKTRLHRLRQDPSVLSLMHLYDSAGRISEGAFSNTPRPPRRRSHTLTMGLLTDKADMEKEKEATLKDLLRAPGNESDDGGGDGDISWADRTLGLYASTSSLSTTTSSLGVQTPGNPIFDHDSFEKKKPLPPTMAVSACDHSWSLTTSVDDLLAISSLEVELSVSTDAGSPSVAFPFDESYSIVNPSPVKVERRLSQRASKVFAFLDEREQPRSEAKSLRTFDPELPTPPASSLSTPSLAPSGSRRSTSSSSHRSLVGLATSAFGIRGMERVANAPSPYVRDGRSVSPSPPSPSPPVPRSKATASTSRPTSSDLTQSSFISRIPTLTPTQRPEQRQYAFESPAPPSASATHALHPPPMRHYHGQPASGLASTALALESSVLPLDAATGPANLKTEIHTKMLPSVPRGPRAPSPGSAMFASGNRIDSDSALASPCAPPSGSDQERTGVMPLKEVTNARARADAMLASFASGMLKERSYAHSPSHSKSYSHIHSQGEEQDLYTPITPRRASRSHSQSRRSSKRLSRDHGSFSGCGNGSGQENVSIATTRTTNATTSAMTTIANEAAPLNANAVADATAISMKSLPLTPARSFARSLLPPHLQPPRGPTPSPASSTELSPEAKQIMADLRSLKSKKTNKTGVGCSNGGSDNGGRNGSRSRNGSRGDMVLGSFAWLR